jgi:hypothetical protein
MENLIARIVQEWQPSLPAAASALAGSDPSAAMIDQPLAEMELPAAGKIEGPTCQGHPDIFRVRWTIPGVMRDGIAKVNSPSFMIGNTTWSVILQLKDETANTAAGLGVFLNASQDSNVMDPDEGGVDACFELAAENKDPQMTEARSLHHRFCRESVDWGFRELVSGELDHTTFLLPMRRLRRLYFFIILFILSVFIRCDVSRSEQQVKAAVLLDRNSGFLNADTLVIKITVRILKETEVREYSMCKQVVVYTIFIYLYTSSCRTLLDLPASFSRSLFAARFLHKGECFS